jgi:hypothetical protein
MSIVRHIDDYVSKKLAPENGGLQPYLSQIQTDAVAPHIILNIYRSSYLSH